MEKNWIILTEISDQLENLNNYPIYLEELLNNLEKQVNEKIITGWKPVGGIQIVYTSDPQNRAIHAHQSMLRNLIKF
jgi:hypothetical protein